LHFWQTTALLLPPSANSVLSKVDKYSFGFPFSLSFSNYPPLTLQAQAGFLLLPRQQKQPTTSIVFNMHLLNTLLALTSLIGFTVSAPSPQLGGIIDPLLGGLLGSIGNLISSGFGDELGSIIPTQLASGILGDAASLIGFEPLITFCQENSANETLVSIPFHRWS
jgi:hypothetical protein